MNVLISNGLLKQQLSTRLPWLPHNYLCIQLNVNIISLNVNTAIKDMAVQRVKK